MTSPVPDLAKPERLVVEDLRIVKGSGATAVPIVDGVSFSVRAGEAFALVGESGSGKSLTLKAIMGLLPPELHTTGRVAVDGVDVSVSSERQLRALRGSQLALLMQDPFTCLNPLLTCRRQMLMKSGSARSASGDELVAERLEEVGLSPELADRYPYELSGGQSQRMAIAMAILEHPSVLLLDEPTTALDVTTQKRVVDLIAELQVSRNMSVVHVTHDMNLAESSCDEIGVLYAGSLVERARTQAIVASPAHPYSLGLMLADPPLTFRAHDLRGLPGSVPPPGERSGGCTFSPRCAWSVAACQEHAPELVDQGDGTLAACLRADDIRSDLRRELDTEAAEAARGSDVGEDLVVVHGLSKSYRGRARGEAGTLAVDEVDLTVRAGECVGIVGESGSGKTTLGRILVGLEEATGGRATVAGVDLGTASRNDLGQLHDVAQMAFQNPYASLNPSLTIGATLSEAARYGGVPRSSRRAEVVRLLTEVGLSERFIARRPSQLSGGERQRVTIARALARRPQLIVCDEVVSALDVSVQAQIIALMRDLVDRKGVSLLFITHDLAVARQICDRVYVMQAGRVVEHGSTADVLDRPRHDYTRTLIQAIPGHDRRGEVERRRQPSAVESG